MKPEAFAIFVLAALLCGVCNSLIFRLYVGLGRSRSLLLGFFAGLAAMSISLGYFATWERHGTPDEVLIPTALGRGLLLLFVAPVAVKLYRALQGQYRAPEEAQPGLAGVRAWLSPGGVALAGLIATAAWYGFDLMWARGFICALAALLTPPLVHSMQTKATPIPVSPVRPAVSEPPEEDLSTDRERVLGLLEAGRITAEECAELLNALAATRRAPRRVRPAMKISGLTWLAAGLLILALVLPWVAIVPGQEMRNLMQQLDPGMREVLPTPSMPGFMNATVYVTGAELAHGLGWFIVLLGLAVVALPSIPTERLDDFQRNLVTLVVLGIGSALLLYTVATGFSHAQIGLAVAVAGYCALWLRNRQALVSTLAPADEESVPVSGH